MFAEKDAAGVFTHPTGCLVAVIGVEHDSGASGFEREDASDYLRQHGWPHSLVGEFAFGDGAV
jgi:hypothetical protein